MKNPFRYLPLSVNGNTLAYDAKGNMTTRVDGSDIVYDGASRPVSVNAGAATYTYGPDGKRISKTAGNTTWHYIGEGRLFSPGHPARRLLAGWRLCAKRKPLPCRRGGIERMIVAGQPDTWTKYPHADVKRIGTDSYWLHRCQIATPNLTAALRLTSDVIGQNDHL